MIEDASASPEEEDEEKKNYISINIYTYICESGPNVGLLMFPGRESRLPLEHF